MIPKLGQKVKINPKSVRYNLFTCSKNKANRPRTYGCGDCLYAIENIESSVFLINSIERFELANAAYYELIISKGFNCCADKNRVSIHVNEVFMDDFLISVYKWKKL